MKVWKSVPISPQVPIHLELETGMVSMVGVINEGIERCDIERDSWPGRSIGRDRDRNRAAAGWTNRRSATPGIYLLQITEK